MDIKEEEILLDLSITDNQRGWLKDFILSNTSYYKIIKKDREILKTFICDIIINNIIGKEDFDKASKYINDGYNSAIYNRKSFALSLEDFNLHEDYEKYFRKKLGDSGFCYAPRISLELDTKIPMLRVNGIWDKGAAGSITENILRNAKVNESEINTIKDILLELAENKLEYEHCLDIYKDKYYGIYRDLGKFKTWRDIKLENIDWFNALRDNYLMSDEVQSMIQEKKLKIKSKSKDSPIELNQVLSRLYEIGKHCNVIK